MSDRREELIDRALRAYNEGDVPGLLDFIHPEVVSRVAEGLGNPGTFDGRDGFLRMMAEWSEAWSENRLDLDRNEHVDDRVTLVCTTQSAVGAGSGVPIVFETVFLVVFEGDRVIRFEIHPSRDSAWAAV